jgi:membrane protease YdiL (CAAX protease family)
MKSRNSLAAIKNSDNIAMKALYGITFTVLSLLFVYTNFSDTEVYNDIVYSFKYINAMLCVNLAIQYYLYKNDLIETNEYSIIFMALACISLPLTEECIFREVIFNKLQFYTSKNMSLHITSFLFGLIHITNVLILRNTLIQGMIQCTAAFVMGYFLYIPNSLIASILLHSYYNSISLVLLSVLTSGDDGCEVDGCEKNGKEEKIEQNIPKYEFFVKNGKLIRKEIKNKRCYDIYIKQRRRSFSNLKDIEKYNFNDEPLKVTKDVYNAHHKHDKELHKLIGLDLY